jgi:putative endonuclease
LHSAPDRRGFVCILTIPKKTTLYIGVTNNLRRRLEEHFQDCESAEGSFSAKYHAYNLVYYEVHELFSAAIAREKQLKGWTRAKKETLISSMNPEWEFLNDRPEVRFMWSDLGEE